MNGNTQIKKVRNSVRTLLSSLESWWGASEWHVITQSILGCLNGLLTWWPGTHTWEIWEKQHFNWFAFLRSSRNIAQFGDNISYKLLKQSGHQRGNTEDTFLDGDFLGMRLRSDKILIRTIRGVIKTRQYQKGLFHNLTTLSSGQKLCVSISPAMPCKIVKKNCGEWCIQQN